jgi:pimeloyl-ACP methyl ester carboxylesterase
MTQKLTLLLLAFCFAGIQQLLALNPSRTYKQLPEKYNMEYKAFTVKTTDGDAELRAWYFPAKSNKTTSLVLIAHNGEGNMADYLRRVDQFINMGQNVVTFDYRGFGESSEFEIDNNMFIYPHFQNDMESMIDHCRREYGQTINLYGWGIGAGLALGIGWNRPEVSKIIADTPFLSMEDLEERFSNWDEPMEVPFAGYEKRFEPQYSLESDPSKTLSGVLLIIGSNDILFTPGDMKTLKNLQPKFVNGPFVVENPDRKDNFQVDKAAYADAISSFLSK